MTNPFEFRELLLKIQDLLSDDDRQRLHFLLGEDVPRNLRDDPSLGGTLRVLQSLFDKAIINEEDCDYLIEALKKIRCFDAAKRLQDYQTRKGQVGAQDLSLVDILWKDQTEQDKIPMRKIIHPSVESINGNGIGSVPMTNELSTASTSRSVNHPESQWRIWLIKGLLNRSITARECLLLTALLISICIIPIVSKPWKKPVLPIERKNRSLTVEDLSTNARWSQNGITVIGNNGSDELGVPSGIHIDDDDVLYVVDYQDNRIVRRRLNSTDIEVIVQGNGADFLQSPSSLTIEPGSNSLIVCDSGNRRLRRLSLQTGQAEEMFIGNIDCITVHIDGYGALYVSDNDKDEVRRYRVGETRSVTVAGGHGEGNNLDQFDSPMAFAFDDEHSLYVTDFNNHRVMKWKRGASEGIVVAGGLGPGPDLARLHNPYGILIDRSRTLYIADSENHRIMRWREGLLQGEVIVGGHGRGNQTDQLDGPGLIAFDRQGNLYVADVNNRRVQQFVVEQY